MIIIWCITTLIILMLNDFIGDPAYVYSFMNIFFMGCFIFIIIGFIEVKYHNTSARKDLKRIQENFKRLKIK